MHSNYILCWILIFDSLQCRGYFSAMGKVVRTDPADGKCTSPLLKNLPESAYTASSVFGGFKPHAAKSDFMYDTRAKQEAWCPIQPVSTTPSEWLQVSFNSMQIITNMVTIGRDDGNSGEFVTSYFFDYQREDGITWFRYRDGDRGELIKGNNDARNPAPMKFISPIVALKVRIIPIDTESRKVCLKIILYGCNFSDGVVEYRIPRGDVLADGQNVTSFDDDRYDGRTFSNNTWLLGGMGKLMDNIVPQSSLNESDSHRLFVAWDRTYQKSDHVELWFRFHAERKMKSVSFYPAIVPSMQLHQFASTIELSDADLNFSVSSVIQDPYVRPIKINLGNKLAKIVRVRIFFRSRWMGLNEVLFETEPMTLAPVPAAPLKPPDGTVTSSISRDYPPIVSPKKMMINITLLACIIAACVASIVIIVLGVLWARQRKRRRYKSHFCDYRSMLMHDQSYHSNVGNIATISGKNPVLYGPVESMLFGPTCNSDIGIRYVHPPYSHCLDYRSHSSQNSHDYDHIESYWPKPPQQNTADQMEGQAVRMAATADTTINNSLNNLSGSVTIYSSTYSSPAYESSLPVPDLVPSVGISQDVYSDIFNVHAVRPLKGLMGASIAPCRSTPVSVSWIDVAFSRLTEISPNKIILQKYISHGQIAAMRTGTVEDCDVGVIVAEIKNHQISSDLKYVFYRHCLATIKHDFSSHPNLLAVIGWCKQDITDVSVVYAYPMQINVVHFFDGLRQTPRNNDDDDVTFQCSQVSQASLLFLMKQLAGALAFLEEIEVIHRDVAARNCSIADGFHLILSDFAIGLEEFRHDYYSLLPSEQQASSGDNSVSATVTLPLLWMPWEAILTGHFSSKSDVWSFGVTLWETFTECQLKPYSIALAISQENPGVVMRNAVLQQSSHPSSVLPNGRTVDQSMLVHDIGSLTDISRQVRDIMHACWHIDPALRPSFHTLYTFLSQLSPDSRFVDDHGSLHRFLP